jgi:hypothetical protein
MLKEHQNYRLLGYTVIFRWELINYPCRDPNAFVEYLSVWEGFVTCLECMAFLVHGDALPCHT